jgi:outer membrane protein assembly factor BamB
MRRSPREDISAIGLKWSQDSPSLHARAMALAGDTLFVAGPPDIIDEDHVFDDPDSTEMQARVADQAEAFAGEKGGLLWAVRAGNGERLRAYTLDAPPVWDGLAAASGRLYLSTMGGNVCCLAPK